MILIVRKANLKYDFNVSIKGTRSEDELILKYIN
jgi:hypothetical protein